MASGALTLHGSEGFDELQEDEQAVSIMQISGMTSA